MSLQHYWDALDRLTQGKPIRAPHSYKINLNTVAVEAGRKPGSIKKSRESHRPLIEAIKIAGEKQQDPIIDVKKKLARQTDKVKSYKQRYHEALNREVMYLETISELTTGLEK